MKRKIIAILAAVITVFGIIIAAAAATGSGSAKPTTNSVSSVSIVVTCTGCLSNNPNSYQFSGATDNGGTSVTYDGNATQTYTLQRNGAGLWIVSFDFQKSTTDGSLELRATLSNGTTVFDQTTSASYGVVSGSFSVGS